MIISGEKVILPLLLIGAALLAGCTTPVMDYTNLADNLKESGATVEAEENLLFPLVSARHPIFSVAARIMTVNSENITVLDYDDEAAAVAEVKIISPDGFDFTVPPSADDEGFGAHVDWIAPPHFYQAGKIIVLYVGENQAIIDLLKSILGPQFAGGKNARTT